MKNFLIPNLSTQDVAGTMNQLCNDTYNPLEITTRFGDMAITCMNKPYIGSTTDCLPSIFFDSYSLALNKCNRNEDAYNSSMIALRSSKWDYDQCERYRFNQQFFAEKLKDRFTSTNNEIITEMSNILEQNRKKESPQITVTMTTCKRIDLFIPTVNSFLQCCLDRNLIDEWIVIDDNSSDEDRSLMKSTFPFINFVLKDLSNKGHPQSMNKLIDLVKTPFVFHMEDDWNFFFQDNYMSKCLTVLKHEYHNGQCLLNYNYGEDLDQFNLTGGIMMYLPDPTEPGEIRYYEHEFYSGTTLDEFCKRNSGKPTCAYWAHYSLRVGMMKKEVWDKLGRYNEKCDHFEREYAYRYANHFRTTFFDSIVCYTTGRKTTERDTGKQNAYDLNNEAQFTNKEKKTSGIELSLEEADEPIEEEKRIIYTHKTRVSTKLINLKRRPDRLKQFYIDNPDISQDSISVIQAVDGTSVRPSQPILRLFESGDYNFRRGIVGCAATHCALWEILKTDPDFDVYCVREDDSVNLPGYQENLNQVLSKLETQDWDVCFLGHFLYPIYRKKEDLATSSTTDISVTRWSQEECIKTSMGGTYGYLVNKRGATRLLAHINKKGVYNGIDWVMFKSSNELSITYCYPHIIASDCASDGKPADTDIQTDYTGVPIPSIIEWFMHEINYWCKELDIKPKEPSKKRRINVLTSFEQYALSMPGGIQIMNMIGNMFESDEKGTNLVVGVIDDEEISLNTFTVRDNVCIFLIYKNVENIQKTLYRNDIVFYTCYCKENRRIIVTVPTEYVSSQLYIDRTVYPDFYNKKFLC